MADQPPPYPEASAPPGGYPPQQAYPPQQVYPPAQGGYPPAQAPGYDEKQAYPPQQQDYPPPAPYPGNPPPVQQQAATAQVTVVTTQPVVVQKPVFRDYPVVVTLENGQQVQTRLDYRAGALTWIVCAVLCLFLSEIGFCWVGLIAFCINPLKDVYHLDPNGNVVGVYRRI